MLNGLFWKIIDFYSVSLYRKVSTNIFKHYKPIIQIHEVIFCPWKLPVTISSVQQNAIISLFLPLKKTWFFKCNYPLLSAQHALRCYAKNFLPGVHCVFPTTLLKLVLFPYFTEKESAALWGRGRKGGARTQAWKGRPRPRSTTLTALTSHMVVRWKHTTQADFLHAACLPPLEGERLQFSHQL